MEAMSRTRLILLLLVLLTIMVYLPVLRCDFINFDDQVYVTDNPHVQAGWTWAGLKWAFTTWYGSNWHPLTWLSHMTDCELFGVNPAAHHAMNVLFHAANAAVLFLLLLRLFPASPWLGAFVAAVFAWHPQHIESVAWVSERKDVLSTLFALLTLHAYLRYARDEHRASFWWALVFFALGLMAKPMLVTVPCLMLLLDWWPLNRISLKPPLDFKGLANRLMEKWPFFLLTVASCVVTFKAQKTGGAMMTIDQMSTALRLEDAVIAYGLYLVKLIWPVHLAVLYPLPDHLSWIHMASATSGAALILISWLVWKARTAAPQWLFGWAWYVGVMVPVIGVVKVGSALLADRYTYISMLGLTIAVAVTIRDWVARKPEWFRPAAVLASLCLAGCVGLTELQLPYWQNSETLFGRALAVTSDNGNAEVNYAAALEMRGDLTNSLAHLRNAVRISPDSPEAHNNIGNMCLKLGNPTNALPEFQEAVRLAPSQARYHNGLGLALESLSRYEEALTEFNRASSLDRDYAWSHFESGNVLLKLGHDPEAIEEFRAALRIDPNNYQILTHVAEVLAATDDAKIRDGKTALIFAQKANYLTGGVQPYILDVLSMAEAEVGNYSEAFKHAEQAYNTAKAAKMKGLDVLEKRMALYQNHQPWRESFTAVPTPPAKTR